MSTGVVSVTAPTAYRGVFCIEGNALGSCLLPMPLDTQMTLALLQELLMALRANDADVTSLVFH